MRARSPAKDATATPLRKAAAANPRRENAVSPAPAATTPRKSTASKRAPRKITPAQALDNTRKLLEAKQEHDRQPPAWQEHDQHAAISSGAAGQFQSPGARLRAEDLHDGESRITAIQGSVSTQDRINQGKRDNR